MEKKASRMGRLLSKSRIAHQKPKIRARRKHSKILPTKVRKLSHNLILTYYQQKTLFS